MSNGAHTLTALATDVDGHTTLSAPVAVNVANGSNFQNEILATGFNLPTAIKFLPDGRMLVVELAGTIKVLPPPYTTPDPRRSCSSPTSAPPAYNREFTTLRLIPISISTTTIISSIHWVRRTWIASRGSRRMRRSQGRSPAANLSSIRIRKLPMPNITAARSTSATTGRSCSQPASISTPARRKISPSRAARSCASTWTAPTDRQSLL